MATPHIHFAIDGAVASLTFNRPEARNALTWEMYDGLVDACDRVDADPAVHVVVLRGAGGQAFAAGTDIAQFTAFDSGADGIAYERRLDAVLDRLDRVRAVTVAQVEGAATGGGCAIALTCDLRVCTPDARFGVPIARTLGNCVSAATMGRLLDTIGPARVKDLLLTGRLMDAGEAESIGLVTRRATADTIDAVVRELAATIAANAPLTIRTTKETIRRLQASRQGPGTQIDDLIAACYGSADFKEGVTAFVARRRPRFGGT